MPTIHPSALVDPAARLGEGVSIGPFCIVGPEVALGDRVVLHSHAVITGATTLGAGTVVFPFASLGHRPQDMKYRGERSALRIGRDCTVREGVTVNPGTQNGGSLTQIGDRCLLMAQAHVGHDCRVGDDVVLSNNVMLAGHVSVGDGAILGGGVGVHQFVRIGTLAFVGGLSGLEGDLIPYGLAMGARARLVGLNLVGLRRNGVDRATIRALAGVATELFGTGDRPLNERVDAAGRQAHGQPLIETMLEFVRTRGKRPLCAVDPAGFVSAGS